MTEFVVTSISFEKKVFEALEKARGNKNRTRSPFLNECLKEKLGLKK